MYIRIHHFFFSCLGWSRTWGEEHFGNGYGHLTLKPLMNAAKLLMISSSLTMICFLNIARFKLFSNLTASEING